MSANNNCFLYSFTILYLTLHGIFFTKLQDCAATYNWVSLTMGIVLFLFSASILFLSSTRCHRTAEFVLLSLLFITPPVAVAMLVMFIKTIRSDSNCIPSSLVRIDLTIIIVTNLSVFGVLLIAVCAMVSSCIKRRQIEKAKQRFAQIYTFILQPNFNLANFIATDL